MSEKNCDGTAWGHIFVAWLFACVATLGSLFLSEIMGYPPCSLCWYQRICMYPLVLIIVMGLFPLSRAVFRFSVPLALVGLGISLFHNLLYYGIIPETLAPCSQGVSCTTAQIEIFGFITIPLLSLTAFIMILFFLYIAHRKLPHEV